MSHYPVNHPLRPLYRVLSALAAIYILVFGVVGLVQTGSGERSEEHTSELQSLTNLVCRLLLEKKKHVMRSTFAGRRMMVSIQSLFLKKRSLQFPRFSNERCTSIVL